LTVRHYTAVSAHELEQLTDLHEQEDFSVPRLLQSPRFRSMLMVGAAPRNTRS
jgi:hypothetical protein